MCNVHKLNFNFTLLTVQCYTHIFMHPNKELCSEMALGEVGVFYIMMPHPYPSSTSLYKILCLYWNV